MNKIKLTTVGSYSSTNLSSLQQASGFKNRDIYTISWSTAELLNYYNNGVLPSLEKPRNNGKDSKKQ